MVPEVAGSIPVIHPFHTGSSSPMTPHGPLNSWCALAGSGGVDTLRTPFYYFTASQRADVVRRPAAFCREDLAFSVITLSCGRRVKLFEN